MQWSKMQGWGEARSRVRQRRGGRHLTQGQVKLPPLPHTGPHLGWGSLTLPRNIRWPPVGANCDTSAMRVNFFPLPLDFPLTQALDYFAKQLVLVINQRRNTENENGSRHLAPCQKVRFLVVHREAVLIFSYCIYACAHYLHLFPGGR